MGAILIDTLDIYKSAIRSYINYLMNLIKLLTFPISIVILCACTPPQKQPGALQFSAAKPEDAGVIFSNPNNQIRIEIHSPSGIGSAEVSLNGQAPQRLTLRFFLKGLEELRFNYNQTEIQASLSSHDAHIIHQSVQTLQADSPEILQMSSPYWLSIQLITTPPSGAYIDVDAPPDFLQHLPDRFSIRWIDFYR